MNTLKAQHPPTVRACESICQRVIRAYRRLPSTLMGDDSSLASAWDDICVQEQQGERSVFWEETYETSLIAFIECEVELLDLVVRREIWDRTDAGIDWDVDRDGPADYIPCADIARYILDQYVLRTAEGYSNHRIRKFLERSELCD